MIKLATTLVMITAAVVVSATCPDNTVPYDGRCYMMAVGPKNCLSSATMPRFDSQVGSWHELLPRSQEETQFLIETFGQTFQDNGVTAIPMDIRRYSVTYWEPENDYYPDTYPWRIRPDYNDFGAPRVAPNYTNWADERLKCNRVEEDDSGKNFDDCWWNSAYARIPDFKWVETNQQDKSWYETVGYICVSQYDQSYVPDVEEHPGGIPGGENGAGRHFPVAAIVVTVVALIL